MSLSDSVKACLSKYATFEGRSSRSEYWWFWLAVFILSYIPFIGIVVCLGCMIPLIAAGVRRLHDTDHCGWWLICPIYDIILLATDGDSGNNEYGIPTCD